MQCLLTSFANPRLTNPLPGLRLDERGELTILNQLLGCCQGDGFSCFSLPDNAYVRCDLNRRLAELRRLLTQFRLTWGFALAGDELKRLKPRAAHQEWLATYKAGRETGARGQAFSSGESPKQPSWSLWALALAAVWKFGLDVHLTSLGRGKADTLLPGRGFGSQRLGLVLIEQKEALWHPAIANDLDAVVNWCEGAMLPLWIDVLANTGPQPLDTDTKTQHLQSAFQMKLRKIKQRPSLSWMSPSCASRLQEVCDGSGEFS